MSYPQEIWLLPACEDGCERNWSPQDNGPCIKRGIQWTRYILAEPLVAIVKALQACMVAKDE